MSSQHNKNVKNNWLRSTVNKHCTDCKVIYSINHFIQYDSHFVTLSFFVCCNIIDFGEAQFCLSSKLADSVLKFESREIQGRFSVAAY